MQFNLRCLKMAEAVLLVNQQMLFQMVEAVSLVTQQILPQMVETV